MKDDDTSGGIIIALIALLIVSPVVSTCEISRSLDRMDKSIETIWPQGFILEMSKKEMGLAL